MRNLLAGSYGMLSGSKVLVFFPIVDKIGFKMERGLFLEANRFQRAFLAAAGLIFLEAKWFMIRILV